MRRMSALLLAAACGCVSAPEDRRPLLTVDDVIRMNDAGVDEGTQLARVQTSRLPAPLSADDIIRLKNEKVPDPVVQAMAGAVTVVERPVHLAPTYSYPYGYHPYGYGYHYRYPYRYSRYPYYRSRYYYVPR